MTPQDAAILASACAHMRAARRLLTTLGVHLANGDAVADVNKALHDLSLAEFRARRLEPLNDAPPPEKAEP